MKVTEPSRSSNVVISGRTTRRSNIRALFNGLASPACTPSSSTTSARGGSMVAVAFGLPTGSLTMPSRKSVPCRTAGASLPRAGHHRAVWTCPLGGHLIALHNQFQAGLQRLMRDLPGITPTTDKSSIPSQPSVGGGHAGDQLEPGDVYLKVPDASYLASVIGHRELVTDVSRMHTPDRNGHSVPHAPGHRHAGRPTKYPQTKADPKSRKHTRPYQALYIAFLPVLADTVGRLHEDTVRLFYHGATLKASGNVDNEGLIGRDREDHRFAQQRHHPDRFSFANPKPRQS